MNGGVPRAVVFTIGSSISQNLHSRCKPERPVRLIWSQDGFLQNVKGAAAPSTAAIQNVGRSRSASKNQSGTSTRG